jgi:hypothetical protein
MSPALRRRRVFGRVRGEVVPREPAVAYPVESQRGRVVVESVSGFPVEQPHVTNNYYVQAPVQEVEAERERVPPWLRVLALVICLAAAVYVTVVVLTYLHVGGPWDVPTHVKGTGR